MRTGRTSFAGAMVALGAGVLTAPIIARACPVNATVNVDMPLGNQQSSITAVAGRSIAVSGVGFSGTSVELRLGANDGPLLGSVPDPRGDFSHVSLQIPAGTAPGFYTVHASDHNANPNLWISSDRSFEVVAPPATTATGPSTDGGTQPGGTATGAGPGSTGSNSRTSSARTQSTSVAPAGRATDANLARKHVPSAPPAQAVAGATAPSGLAEATRGGSSQVMGDLWSSFASGRSVARTGEASQAAAGGTNPWGLAAGSLLVAAGLATACVLVRERRRVLVAA